MLAPTHLIAGQAAYLATALAVGHAPDPVEAWCAAGAALLPDLDKRQGLMGRWFPWISEPLEYHFGHRTLTHSLLFCTVLGFVLWWLLPFGPWLAAVAGYASHPVADWMTPAGVEWLWPGRWRCVLPGNERYRMRPMGWGELAFAGLLCLACVPLVVLGRSAAATGGVISSAIGDIAAARERYDAAKGSSRWTLEVEGRDNRSYADVTGVYPVIGEYGAGGFLLRGPAGPVTVCRTGCDWYADSAVLERGEARETTSRRLAAGRTTPAALREAVAPLRDGGDVYLVGTLTGRQIKADGPTVAVSGTTVTLRYARPAQLQDWPEVVLRDVDVTVQVRHAPGAAVPEAGRLAHDARPALPVPLRRWVE